MPQGSVGQPWSAPEIAAILDSYFEMLRSELRGDRYVKSHQNQRVQAATGRSRGSVEHKYMNVSAALLSMGLVHIDGYKPERNLQAALRDAVADYVSADPRLLDLMDTFVRREEPTPGPDMVWNLDVSPAPTIEYEPQRSHDVDPVKVDFVAREAANRSLGLAGEIATVRFEQRRLRAVGRPDLADRVEHVSRTRGDGAGFDVLSFDGHAGNRRYIEVKTTRRSEHSPFYVSRNEVEFSRREADSFVLYRLFRFGSGSRGVYQLDGALDRTCRLDPAQYAAVPARAVW